MSERDAFLAGFLAAAKLAPPVLRESPGRACRSVYDGSAGPKGMIEHYEPRFVAVPVEQLAAEAWDAHAGGGR